eukprot:GHVU01009405.1.p1 GENE.GHVU01009405.1~~GHVU01009405.1.p1  ORF type:complete len:161 (-),score=18.61 GHVU01009405.1:70-552(-)
MRGPHRCPCSPESCFSNPYRWKLRYDFMFSTFLQPLMGGADWTTNSAMGYYTYDAQATVAMTAKSFEVAQAEVAELVSISLKCFRAALSLLHGGVDEWDSPLPAGINSQILQCLYVQDCIEAGIKLQSIDWDKEEKVVIPFLEQTVAQRHAIERKRLVIS